MGKQKIRKTQEEFEKEVFDLVGTEFEVLGSYQTNKTKIRFKHTICGKEFDMTPGNFLYGQRCPHCNSNFGKVTIEDAKNAFLKKGLILLEDEYINNTVKMRYKCKKCGCEHATTYSDITYKTHGCAGCSKNKKLTFSEVREKIEAESGYSVISEENDFKNVHSKLIIKHSCGVIYSNSFNNFRNGQRCPVCAAKASAKGLSKEVIKIIDYLLKNKIDFEIEKKFNDLKIESRNARFDFYFKNKNLLLEYQGKQHIKDNVSSRFTKEKLEKIRLSDSLKKEYAKNNNINLEYILYTDDSIEKLKEILSKY